MILWFYEQNQGRNNYLNHKIEYLASKMLIQVLRDLINLFVEVKIKLFDSKCFLIKWNFQLPCETSGLCCRFPGKVPPRSAVLENISHWDFSTLLGGTGVRSFKPNGKAPAATGITHHCPRRRCWWWVSCPALPHTSLPCWKSPFPPVLDFESRLHQDMEKIHPILWWNRPRYEGRPRDLPPSSNILQPTQNITEIQQLLENLPFSNKSIWKLSWGRR